jgi:hypothetical protein
MDSGVAEVAEHRTEGGEKIRSVSKGERLVELAPDIVGGERPRRRRTV